MLADKILPTLHVQPEVTNNGQSLPATARQQPSFCACTRECNPVARVQHLRTGYGKASHKLEHTLASPAFCAVASLASPAFSPAKPACKHQNHGPLMALLATQISQAHVTIRTLGTREQMNWTGPSFTPACISGLAGGSSPG